MENILWKPKDRNSRGWLPFLRNISSHFVFIFFFSGLWEIDFLYLSLFYVIFSTRILSFIADYCSAVAFPWCFCENLLENRSQKPQEEHRKPKKSKENLRKWEENKEWQERKNSWWGGGKERLDNRQVGILLLAKTTNENKLFRSSSRERKAPPTIYLIIYILYPLHNMYIYFYINIYITCS